nr:HAD hydrolase-like protein [Gemmiger qucibialis]
MYKTVVLDLDGTLLNTLTDLADAGNRLCRKYGWPTHERQAYRYFVGNGIPKLVERLAPADQRTPAVLEAALADFKRDYGQHLRDTTAPYPGIPEMLAKLKANG